MINKSELQKLNNDLRYYMSQAERETIMRCISYMKYSKSKFLKINLKRGYVFITKLTAKVCELVYRNKASRIYMNRQIEFKQLYNTVYNTL